MLRRFIACTSLLILSLLFFSCETVRDPREDPDFGDAIVHDKDILTTLTAVSVEYIGDLSSRIFVATRLATNLYGSGLDAQAERILGKAARWVASSTNGLIRAQLLSEIARVFITNDEFQRAFDLLQAAFDIVIEIQREEDRSRGLEAIILQIFRLGQTGTELLRDAIDYVYIIEDPFQRVRLLTDLVRVFQEQDRAARATVLLQQGLAASAIIGNPWAKAEAMVQIARRFRSDGNEEDFLWYTNAAISEIENNQALVLSTGDSQSLQRTLLSLADAGRLREAQIQTARLTDVYTRNLVLISIAERYRQAKNDLQARLIEQRVQATIPNIEDAGVRALLVFRMAELHSQFSTPQVQDAIAAAEAVLNSVVDSSRDELSQRLSALQGKHQSLEKALSTIAQIDEGYIAAQALLELQETLTDLPAAQQRSLILLAAERVRSASYLQEPAKVEIAVRALLIGESDISVTMLSDIDDPFLLASFCLDSLEKSQQVQGISPRLSSTLEEKRRNLLTKIPGS